MGVQKDAWVGNDDILIPGRQGADRGRIRFALGLFCIILNV